MPFPITVDVLTIRGSLLVDWLDFVVEETLDALARVDWILEEDLDVSMSVSVVTLTEVDIYNHKYSMLIS
jgi:L-ribulose-5-phosphate 3-epimerase UlaE